VSRDGADRPLPRFVVAMLQVFAIVHRSGHLAGNQYRQNSWVLSLDIIPCLQVQYNGILTMALDQHT
jgi:hypothetical protein